MYKNIGKQIKLSLKDEIIYQDDQVVSKTLVQNDYVSMTLFAFEKDDGRILNQPVHEVFLLKPEKVEDM